MVQVQFEDIDRILAKFKDLYKLNDVKKSQINSIFRDATKPMVRLAKSNIGRRRKKYAEIKSRYQSRIHAQGALRKHTRFYISKKYRLAYYVGTPDKRQSDDLFYKRFYIMGTKGATVGSRSGKAAYIGGRWVAPGTTIKGQKPHPYMDIAIAGTKNQVFNSIGNGVFKIQEREWAK